MIFYSYNFIYCLSNFKKNFYFICQIFLIFKHIAMKGVFNSLAYS